MSEEGRLGLALEVTCLRFPSDSPLSSLDPGWFPTLPPNPCLPWTVSQTDCFVSLWLPTASREKLKTRTISNCPNPEWNETFSFQIQSQVKVRLRGHHVSVSPAYISILLHACLSFCLLLCPSYVYLSFFPPTSSPPSDPSSHSPTSSLGLPHICPSESTYPSTFFPSSLVLLPNCCWNLWFLPQN